jgi:hypothetical protein
MHEDDADRFRKQVEECRQQAEKAISQLDKETWLRVAAEWLKLAMSAERHREEGRLSRQRLSAATGLALPRQSPSRFRSAARIAACMSMASLRVA